MRFRISRRFTSPHFEQYDGKGDPIDHLEYFKQTMAVHLEDDALMCRMFPSSLAPTTMTWFYRLEPSSIDSFDELNTTFPAHCITSCKAKKDVDALFDVIKGGDSLRTYVTKFKLEMLLSNICNPYTSMVDFRKGMAHNDELSLSLAGRLPQDIIEMFTRAEEYCFQEDERCRGMKIRNASERIMRPHDNNSSKSTSKKPRREEVNEASAELPLNIPLHQVYEKIKNEPFLEKAHPIRGNNARRDLKKHRSYKNVKGHATESCYLFRDRVRDLINKGLLKESLSKSNEKRPTDQDMSNKIIIHTIHRGCVNSYHNKVAIRQMVKTVAHKWEVNSITLGAEQTISSVATYNSLEFTDDDLIPVSLPHNDALVITVLISNCVVHRCLIDTGSSTELLFQGAFNQMNISRSELINSICSLVGFNDNVSYAAGKIRLVVSLGSQHSY